MAEEGRGRLETPDGITLSYHRIAAPPERADRPQVMFLTGLRSDMSGTKAEALADWARATGTGFLRFDYRGHGGSSGAFTDATISDWLADATAIFDRLSRGRVVLVGSSLGGWLALLLAQARSDRVAGLVGIAAAPDFTEALIWAGFDAAQRDRLLAEGRVALPSAYDPEDLIVTRALIEDGRRHLLLQAPIAIAAPVRLLHGTDDADVPVELAHTLFGRLDGADVRLTLVKHGDHRLSRPADLALMLATVAELTA